MVTSFEHILLLDSDNMIVSNPDEIFESKLYHQYGMITWPDYWKEPYLHFSTMWLKLKSMKIKE